MKKNKISKNWVNKQRRDIYVRQSKIDGYRARSAYKLMEIDEKFSIFKGGLSVVDIGAAPGSWSQYAEKKIKNGKLISIDLKTMEPLGKSVQIQGDFTEDATFEELLAVIGNRPVDLVISDMAPNLTGAKAVDQPAMMYLAELAIDLTCRVMKAEGVFIAKLFQGEGFDQFVRHVRTVFNTVSIKKPDASRAKSREVYLVAKGLKGQ